jgi:hypothetical protein
MRIAQVSPPDVIHNHDGPYLMAFSRTAKASILTTNHGPIAARGRPDSGALRRPLQNHQPRQQG